MARSILALALLGMLVFASAERSLLAHKVQGGQSLHAVALTGSSWALPTGAAILPTGLPTAQATPFYYLTTGNGTWAPTANGMLVSGSSVATVVPGSYLNAVQNPGSLWNTAVNPTTLAGYTSTAVNSYFLPTSVVAVGQPGFNLANLQSGATNAGTQFNGLLASGVTSVVFPSKTLGIAVGLTGASTASTGASALGATGAANLVYPTIVTTIDGGVSWNDVSGFSPVPTFMANTWVIPSFPQFTAPPTVVTAIFATSTLVNINSGVQTSAPAPDLTSVFCASKNLCFAAGGFMPVASTPATSTTLASINTGSNVLASDLPSWGQILRSTNGGTYWSYTQLPTNYMPSSPQCTFNPANVAAGAAGGFAGVTAAQNAYFQDLALTLTGQSLCPVPGLLAISATANGKIVVATGSPGLPVVLPGALPSGNFYSATAAATAASSVANFGVIPTPVILYSSNSGASYTVQQAPVHPGNFLYTLNAVAVIKSTLAFAAGGNPYGTQGAVGSTAVLATATVAASAVPFGVVALGPAVGTPASATQVNLGGGVQYAFQSPAALATGTTVTVVQNSLPPGLSSGGVAAAVSASNTAAAIAAGCAGVYGCTSSVTGATLSGSNVMATAQIVPAGGIIVASFNGGFTWAMQTIAGSYTYSCTQVNQLGFSYAASATLPLQAVNAASFNPAGTAFSAGTPGSFAATAANAIQSFFGPCGFYTGGRVQPYNPVVSQSANTIPAINSLAFTQGSNNVPLGTTGGNVAFAYNGWAVGDSGLVLKTTVTPSTIASIASSASSTVITTWTVYSIPALNVIGTGTFVNLYGILWDNVNVGYIYGAGVILSTHNGGTTWQIETPNNLISGTTIVIPAAAIVPTNY